MINGRICTIMSSLTMSMDNMSTGKSSMCTSMSEMSISTQSEQEFYGNGCEWL